MPPSPIARLLARPARPPHPIRSFYRGAVPRAGMDLRAVSRRVGIAAAVVTVVALVAPYAVI
ncbi:hypothetical protein EXE43_28135, partial [Halorubrum sp. SS5]